MQSPNVEVGQVSTFGAADAVRIAGFHGYRGAKFSLFEGGIRVPAIIRWPEEFAGGSVRDQFAVSIDWLPGSAPGADRLDSVIPVP